MADEPVVDHAAEREERFRRVAGKRANRILGDMELLLRTANRSGGYSYTPEQAEEVVGKIRLATDKLEAAFSGGTRERLTVEL